MLLFALCGNPHGKELEDLWPPTIMELKCPSPIARKELYLGLALDGLQMGPQHQLSSW